MRSKKYGPDVLAPDTSRPRRQAVPEMPVEAGLVVEDAGTGFCGAVVGWEKDAVSLEDRHGRQRVYPLPATGLLLEGRPVTLVRPRPTAARLGSRTASGSVAVHRFRARVAQDSRIYVEGRHDAELVERIWGDDLRIEGVVVEYLEGVDDLPRIVAEFAPEPGRRLGVLVDHLVSDSKESRIAAAVRSPHVLVTGHPYVDIWQAVKPSVLGIPAWPEVPPGTPWKEGVLAGLGWPDDVPGAWRRILSAVRSYTDLEPALLGRVEELIDFVTTQR